MNNDKYIPGSLDCWRDYPEMYAPLTYDRRNPRRTQGKNIPSPGLCWKRTLREASSDLGHQEYPSELDFHAWALIHVRMDEMCPELRWYDLWDKYMDVPYSEHIRTMAMMRYAEGNLDCPFVKTVGDYEREAEEKAREHPEDIRWLEDCRQKRLAAKAAASSSTSTTIQVLRAQAPGISSHLDISPLRGHPSGAAACAAPRITMNESTASFTPVDAWRAGEDIMAAERAEAAENGYAHEDLYGTPDPHRNMDALRSVVDFDDFPQAP